MLHVRHDRWLSFLSTTTHQPTVSRPIFQMSDVHKTCCQLLVGNIHRMTTFQLPTENVVTNMLATEESVRVWRALDNVFITVSDYVVLWDIITNTVDQPVLETR